MMGKTRIEELCYELYGSWNQHDSWHRYAMIRELRELMKQPKGGSDHFERFGDDRRIDGDDRRFGVGQFRDGADDDEEQYLVMDEELAEIEDRAVENEANAEVISAIVKKEQIPQIQVPSSKLEHGLQIHKASPTVCEDSQYVVGCDELFEHQKAIIQVSQVKARDELLMNSKNVTNNQDAPHLFDKKPLRVQTRKGHIKCHKTWRFKFKQGKQQRGKLRSAHQLIHRGNVRSKFRNKNFQKMMREHGHFSHLKLKSDMGEDDEMFTGAKAVSMRFLLGNMLGITESDASQRQQAVLEKVVMMNEWLQPSLVIEQVMRDKKIKFTKQWMFKFKVDSKLARINHILHQEKKPKPELVEEKESKLQVLDLHQTFLCHQIGCGIDILLVVKMLDHGKGMAVVLQRSTSFTTRDCPDRSSRANRVWKPGLEIYGCVIKKQMLLNDKLANHVWHRWKNKAGKLKASLVCSGKRWSFVVYAFYDHTVVLRKEPILSPKIKRGFELSYLPNLEVKVSLKGEDLI